MKPSLFSGLLQSIGERGRALARLQPATGTILAQSNPPECIRLRIACFPGILEFNFYALPRRCRLALFIAAVRLAACGGAEFDVVIFAGDALDIGSFVDFRAQILVVKKYLSLLSGMTRVILCSGNHDLDERSAEGEKIARWVGEIRELGIACDGDDLTIGDTRFTVCPWWDGPLVKGRLEAQLRDAAANRAQRWIWVHHAPPANSPTSWGGKRFFGDVELVQWIAQYQPSMVISGHVHQSPFIPDGSWFDRLGATWVFNTGLQHGRPPVHIVLDLDEGAAFWLAAGEAQRIDLRAPCSGRRRKSRTRRRGSYRLGRIAEPNLHRSGSSAHLAKSNETQSNVHMRPGFARQVISDLTQGSIHRDPQDTRI